MVGEFCRSKIPNIVFIIFFLPTLLNACYSVGNTCNDISIFNNALCDSNQIIKIDYFDTIKNYLFSFFHNFEKNDSLSTDNAFNPVKCIGNSGCIRGAITKIIDGDTLDVNNIRIRLSMINTPEFGERGYNDAKNLLFSVCGIGSKVVVDLDDGQKEGSYDRKIGLVYCENNGNTILLNKLLLDTGSAKFLYHLCKKSEFANTDWAHRYGCN